jgi:hypothetical protein
MSHRGCHVLFEWPLRPEKMAREIPDGILCYVVGNDNFETECLERKKVKIICGNHFVSNQEDLFSL